MLYPITLDRDRTFKYSMRALSLAEKKLGRSIMGLNMAALSMEQIAALAWCGLRHEDDKLTIENVMDLIDEHSNITEIMNILAEAIQQVFGIKPDEDAEKN